MEMKLWNSRWFEMEEEPITIPRASRRADGARPTGKRAMYLAAVIILSFGLGISVVCLASTWTTRSSSPSIWTAGLTLPPSACSRIRRRVDHRGGHLWTPRGARLIEADAYRNPSRQLAGACDRRGPDHHLLVTSAKAGEGRARRR